MDHVAAGEPFITTKAGKPRVAVVPLDALAELPESRFGFLAGQINVPDDFDTMGQIKIESMFHDGT